MCIQFCQQINSLRREKRLHFKFFTYVSFELSVVLFLQSCDAFLFSEYSSCHLQSTTPVRPYRLTHSHLLPATSVSTLPAKLILSPLKPQWGVSFPSLADECLLSKSSLESGLATTVKANVIFSFALQTVAWNGRCWSSSLWCSATEPHHLCLIQN